MIFYLYSRVLVTIDHELDLINLSSFHGTHSKRDRGRKLESGVRGVREGEVTEAPSRDLATLWE